MFLETERLFLRDMQDEDFDALFKVLADRDIMKHYPYTFDDKRVKNWIFRNKERYEILGFGLWSVCLKATGEMIGDCGLSMQTINGVIRPEIGYHIRGDMQRKGYAKEASIAVRDWAFRNTPFNTIYSYLNYMNEASARTAMSYGCKLVDEYPDNDMGKILVYAITRAEWEKMGHSIYDQPLRNASVSVAEMKKVLGRRLDVLIPKWESITGLHPAGYKMRAMRTRWATCNIRTRMLCFSTMLYDKPDEFVEYVVLHELAHLKVANHGADFKALLTFYMPNWRVVRKMGQ